MIKDKWCQYIERFKLLNRWWKSLHVITAALFITMVGILVLRLLVGWGILVSIPSHKELTTVAKPIASELYDRNGHLLGRYYVENRSHMEMEDLNPFFHQALIATEDRRFYDHDGVDTRSLFRVLFKTIILQKDASGGGSTITQQLAKHLYPRKRYRLLSTLINKFREMEIAQRLEDIYDKKDILLLYSNTVSFGEQAFGLPTAAKRFFNKHPQDLLLEEAATLVGMLKAPSYYSPRRYPERARKRRNVVLSQMEKYDFITSAVRDQLSALPLDIDYQPPSHSKESARYFKEKVKRDFRHWAMERSKQDGAKYDLFTDGLKVYTTLDLSLQREAENIMQSHMSKLQKIFEKEWSGGRMYGPNNKLLDEKITNHPIYQKLRNEGKSAKEALSAFTKIEEQQLWTWDGEMVKNTTKIDSIKHYLKLLHSSMIAIQPRTGEVLTWIGGNDYDNFQWDNVTGPRQVGSTFKPIVYLTALEKGIDPCEEFDIELVTYKDYDDWTPKNASGQYGGIATMKGALTHSINTVSVKLLFEVGIPAVSGMAKKLGITSPLDEVPSMVLGTSDISLLEMIKVYSVFANRGVKRDVTTILKIEDGEGNVLYDAKKSNASLKDERIVEQESVDMLNEMLLNATVHGTGRRLYQDYDIRFPVMGKTGTTQNQSDGWYIGYNEDLVIGAWVGTEDRRIHFRSLRSGSGGSTALPMVASLFTVAADKEYITNHKARITEITECPDTLSARPSLSSVKDQLEKIGQDIMARYEKIARDNNGKVRKSRKDKNIEKKYRKYRRAIEELERKIKELDEELKKN